MRADEIDAAADRFEQMAATATRRGSNGGERGRLERAAAQLREAATTARCEAGEHVHDPDGSPCLCCGQVSA